MTPVNQRTRDDCFRACVASILNLRYEDVPHFMDGIATGAELPPAVTARIHAWFTARELTYWEMGYRFSPAEVLQRFRTDDGHSPTYLMMGRGSGSINHCIVCRAGGVIHDPGAHLGSHGVTEPCIDGYTRVGLIVVNKPDILETVSKQE